ncbi:MAG TPA: DUF4440 domain-containing protein [Longimicrobiales bacterium]|nr:DUF4440 domain-containing protein [Longimicrobiales bacterium]
MTPTLALDALQQRIDAANRGFETAFNAGDPAGAARGIYSREARVLPPGAPMVRGRDAIEQFWAAAAAQMGIRAVKLTTLELEPLGDGAFEIGRAALTLAGGAEVEVKYAVVWKQEDGGWKWHVDIWNTDV